MEKTHPVCPKCGSDKYHLYGKSDRGKQKYQCTKCGRFYLAPEDYKPSAGVDCPECGSSKTIKQGTRILSGGARKQRYKCKACNHSFYGLPPTGDPRGNRKNPTDQYLDGGSPGRGDSRGDRKNPTDQHLEGGSPGTDAAEEAEG